MNEEEKKIIKKIMEVGQIRVEVLVAKMECVKHLHEN
jgi:hypothetical protein